MAFAWIFPTITLEIIALVLGIDGRSSLTNYKQTTTIMSTINTGLHTHRVTNSSDARLVQIYHSSTQGSHWSKKRTFQEDSTPLIEASTAGIVTTVLKDTNTNQKRETSSWSLSMTKNHSLITTPQISKSSEEALDASWHNSIAHFTHTAVSKKKDTSIQQITLLPSTQIHTLLVTSKKESSNPVTVDSVSASLARSSSSVSHELFSRATSLPTSRSDISATTSTTTAKGVSVTMHDKSSTNASVITVSSPSTGTYLTSHTKQQRTSSVFVVATSSHAIKPTELPFGSVSTSTLPGNSIWTSFSRTKEILDSIQTQSSPLQEKSPFIGKTASSIGLDMTKTFGTAATALVDTVSSSTQTGPPPVSPKQFDVVMVLQMTWESHYEYSYTPEFQALASRVKTQVTTVLMTLDGFLSLNVLRFWKGSVGVDFVVFVKKGAEVSEDTVERTLITANNSGLLDLPLTSIQVQEGETTTRTVLPATKSTKEDKSIERWMIVLIVAGILVFLMSLIICYLLVKLTKQRGRNKYQVSGANSYLSYLYTDCLEPGSKPVILRMEERRRDVKDDSSAASAYETLQSSSSRGDSMSHRDSSIPPNDYNNGDYEWKTNDSATSSTVMLSMEERIKELKEDPINITSYTTAGSDSIQRLSHKEVQAKISTDEKWVHQNHGFKDEDTF